MFVQISPKSAHYRRAPLGRGEQGPKAELSSGLFPGHILPCSLCGIGPSSLRGTEGDSPPPPRDAVALLGVHTGYTPHCHICSSTHTYPHSEHTCPMSRFEMLSTFLNEVLIYLHYSTKHTSVTEHLSPASLLELVLDQTMLPRPSGVGER